MPIDDRYCARALVHGFPFLPRARVTRQEKRSALWRSNAVNLRNPTDQDCFRFCYTVHSYLRKKFCSSTALLNAATFFFGYSYGRISDKILLLRTNLNVYTIKVPRTNATRLKHFLSQNTNFSFDVTVAKESYE